MTFCTIDGITLTVDSSTPKLAVEEVGQRGRAFDGTAQVGVRVVKRGWDLLLNPLNEADAIALMHLLLGKGVYFPFTSNAQSSNGYLPVTFSNLQYNLGQTISDAIGAGQNATNDVPFGAYLGNGALYLDQPATNLLSTDTASLTGGAGSAAAIDSATLARSGGISVDGSSGSLQITTLANSNSVKGGVNIPTAATVAGGTYTGSVYLRAASGTPSVDVNVTDSLGGTGAVVTVQLSTTQWTRVMPPAFAIINGKTARITVVEHTADSAISFYYDQAAIEALGGPSRWQVGAGSRATTGRLNLSSATLNPFGTGWSQAWTMNLWALGGQTSTDGYLYYVSASNYLKTNSTTITWTTPQGGSLTGTWAPYGGAWQNVACVQYQTATGATVSELWVNGVLAATNTSALGVAPFDPNTATSFDIGSNAGSSQHCGPIDSLLFVPCRLTSKWIAALYNQGAGCFFGAWPKHRLSGDILTSRAAATVVNQVKDMAPTEYYDTTAAAWCNNGYKITVEVLEV